MACTSVTDVSKAILDSGNGIALLKRGRWVLVYSDTQKEPIATFEETARALVANSSSLLKTGGIVRQLMQFIGRFNEAWTSALLAQKRISAFHKDDGIIQFNSYNKYAWLSNFFKTLIFDPINLRLLFHVEGGYVAFKATLAGEGKQGDALAAIFDPKEAKSEGSVFIRDSSTDDLAVKEMERLALLKFEQNSILLRLLISSGSCELEEYTSDVFWGTANGTLYSDESNHLGKIHMKIRHHFQKI